MKSSNKGGAYMSIVDAPIVVRTFKEYRTDEYQPRLNFYRIDNRFPFSYASAMTYLQSIGFSHIEARSYLKLIKNNQPTAPKG
jgi:hypothetical protein